MIKNLFVSCLILIFFTTFCAPTLALEKHSQQTSQEASTIQDNPFMALTVIIPGLPQFLLEQPLKGAVFLGGFLLALIPWQVFLSSIDTKNVLPCIDVCPNQPLNYFNFLILLAPIIYIWSLADGVNLVTEPKRKINKRKEQVVD